MTTKIGRQLFLKATSFLRVAPMWSDEPSLAAAAAADKEEDESTLSVAAAAEDDEPPLAAVFCSVRCEGCTESHSRSRRHSGGGGGGGGGGSHSGRSFLRRRHRRMNPLWLRVRVEEEEPIVTLLFLKPPFLPIATPCEVSCDRR